MVQKYKKNMKYFFDTKKVVPLHPLFGVIAGRKYREACYVALERYNNLII